MKDYKEQIGQLRQLSMTRYALIHTEWSYAFADAATALETLLAERDAAVEDLRLSTCQVCKHKETNIYGEPCRYCFRKNKFEWRGPQK